MLHVDSDCYRKEFDNYSFANECLAAHSRRLCATNNVILRINYEALVDVQHSVILYMENLIINHRLMFNTAKLQTSLNGIMKEVYSIIQKTT